MMDQENNVSLCHNNHLETHHHVLLVTVAGELLCLGHLALIIKYSTGLV